MLGVNRQRRHTFTWLLVLIAVALASLILGVAIGTVYVLPDQIVGILGHRILGLPAGSWTAATEAIVWDVRLPRVILGLSVGTRTQVRHRRWRLTDRRIHELLHHVAAPHSDLHPDHP